MGRRKDSLDQDALREKLIAVAEALVNEKGVEALTARALAAHIGYSVGHIYNLVADLDELVLLVNAHTLDDLFETLQDACEGIETPAERLHALAQTYIHFCAKKPRLWQLVLSHKAGDGKDLPEAYLERIALLPQLVAQEVKTLTGRTRTGDAVKRDVALLWASLQGLSSLDLSGRLALIGTEDVQHLARTLIDTYITAHTTIKD